MLSLNGKCLDMMVQCWQGKLAQLWQARQLGVDASLDVSTNACRKPACLLTRRARTTYQRCVHWELVSSLMCLRMWAPTLHVCLQSACEQFIQDLIAEAATRPYIKFKMHDHRT